MPADLEASEDAISGWLQEYGDVFGVQTPQKTELSQQDIAALRQMDVVTNGAMSPDRAEDLMMRVQNAASAEELNSIIYSQQSNS